MITNHLLLKLKMRDAETIKKAQEVLLSMNGKIDELKNIRVEVDISHLEPSYDLLAIEQFNSMEDFKAFAIHPAHMEVARYIHSVLDTQACVCYES